MLATLLAPSSGRATVCGFDATKQANEVRRRIGYVTQQIATTRNLLTGRQCVEMKASLSRAAQAGEATRGRTTRRRRAQLDHRQPLSLPVRVIHGTGHRTRLTAGLLSLAVTASFSALAYWVPGHGTFFATDGFITMPLLFISNAIVPLEAMPRWMEITARLNPLTYAIEAMRIPIVESWNSDTLVSMAVLVAVGLACLACGAQQFNRRTGERVK